MMKERSPAGEGQAGLRAKAMEVAVTDSKYNIPDPAPDNIRAILNAQERVNKAVSDRLDAIENAHNALRDQITAIFHRKEGTPYTVTESVMALDHRVKMKEGELMGLWGAYDKVEGELQALHSLITGPRRHIANGRPRDYDGVSPVSLHPKEGER